MPLILAFELLVFLLACVAMMATFMGGSGYLGALLVLLGLSLPASLLVVLAGPAWFMQRHGPGTGMRRLWNALPQWAAVAFWLAVALIFCGELALVVTLQLAEVPPAPWQHLPLVAGLLAALGFAVNLAVREACQHEKTLP